jgi:4-hydroxy-3-polyprenylbenzoate decarboxylase
MRVIVGITGASGVVYSKRLLEILNELNIDTHLVISRAGYLVIKRELKMDVVDLKKLATVIYDNEDLMAPISSGSFDVDAMIVIPASMKTISSISVGISSNLITRAADVQIKENRKLILVPRETPLNAIHLENLAKLAKLGVTILPAMPGFYHDPESIESIVDFIVGKILDQLKIDHNLYKRWTE